MHGLRWLRRAALSGCTLLSPLWGAEGKSGLPEPQAKVEILLALPAYLTWPASRQMERKEQPFNIGILGLSPLSLPLHEASASRSIRGKRITVKYAQRVQDLLDCHMVFLRDSDGDRLPEVLRALVGKGVLTVGDGPQFAAQGVMVNLFFDRKRIGLEVNLAALRQEGLEASGQFLRLAKLVE